VESVATVELVNIVRFLVRGGMDNRFLVVEFWLPGWVDGRIGGDGDDLVSSYCLEHSSRFGISPTPPCKGMVKLGDWFIVMIDIVIKRERILMSLLNSLINLLFTTSLIHTL
jgi:hypothetical protein